MRTKRALVVDNNPVFLTLLKKLLTRYGYAVWTTDSSLSALDIVEKIKPSLIFIDLIMPNISGEKLCKKIRESSRRRKTKIILITAVAAENPIDYSEWGFDACIAKGPFPAMSKGIVSLLDQIGRSKDGILETRIGYQGIYPREITKELLAIKENLESVLSRISEGILEITDDRRIIYVNPAAIEIIGKPEFGLLASDFLQLFKKTDRKRVVDHLDSSRSTGQQNDHDFFLWNGKRVSLGSTVTGKGKSTRIIVMSDITAKRLAEDALRRRATFEKLVTDISTHFINLSSDRLDRSITAALKKMGKFAGADRSYVFLYSSGDARSMNYTHEWCAPGIAPQLERMKKIDILRQFPWFARQIENKRMVYLPRTDDLPEEAAAEKSEFRTQGIQSMINIPMVAGGKMIGFLGFDSVRQPMLWPEEIISLLKIVGEILANALIRGATENALRASEKKYRELADLLPQVVFETDTEGNLTFANRQAVLRFGPSYKTEEQVNALQFIVPEERPQARAHFQKILKGEVHPPPEFRFLNQDGSVSSMMVYAARIRNRDRTTGLRGVSNDITERKRWEDLYRTVAEKSLAAVYLLVDGRFRYVNPRFAAFTGYDPEEVIGRKSVSLIYPEDKKKAKADASAMLKGLRHSPYEFRIIRKDGNILWAVETVSSVYYEGRRAVLGNLMDLTELKTTEERLRYLSTHDGLTKLYNRAYFETEVERLAQGRKFPIRILIADLDFLKKTNDTLGHAAGDDLIRRAAAVLKQAFRKEDIVARIGGDEFAAVWTDSGRSSEAGVLRRIRNALSAHNRMHPDQPLSLSLGIVTGQQGCSVGDLMKEADMRMYREKAARKRSAGSLR